MSAIPIANLYYLLTYAWDCFREGKQIDVGIDKSPDLPNLLGSVLVSGTKRLIRRGLDTGYQTTQDDLRAPRGRFQLTQTIKSNLLTVGRIVCEFDELSTDVPHNRILKAAILMLCDCDQISDSLRPELRAMLRRLRGVTQVSFSKELFRTLQLTKNSGHYRLLMNVCEMLLNILLPAEHGLGAKFADILADETRMSRVFEAFIRNFYKKEQTAFYVKAERLSWELTSRTPGDEKFVPVMITDVTLTSPSRTVVIDAKFYKETLVSSRFGGQPKIRSGHLYQLMAYLQHYKTFGKGTHPIEGVLLYPSTDGQELRMTFEIYGHSVSVRSIDMRRPWQEIHDQLLKMVALSDPAP